MSAFSANPGQQAVITAAAGERIIVDAGPGTGKTATAAARAIALVENGLPPERLWLVSFARAAVAEMRQRLVSLAGDHTGIPRVSTLDSLAWRLRSGELDGDGADLEGHDAAIAETLAALRRADPDMRRQLAAVDHLIVDETQDLVGPRALLMLDLIAALPPESGVTLLTDEAQAIYGFAGGALDGGLAADTVAQHLLATAATEFRRMELNQVHRTGDGQLLRLFGTVRRHALQEASNPRHKLARVRRAVVRHAHNPVWRSAKADGDGHTLILFRSRAEVLATATTHAQQNRPYRLRLSGLPVALQPWIAQTLFDQASASLSRHGFARLWQDRIGESDELPAWHALCQAIGNTAGERLDMKRLLQILRTSQPPSELCRFDPGAIDGPVIGTIHASKGREMDVVKLMLPRDRSGNNDPDGESRVLFVGATRAKRRLETGQGLRLAAKRLASGRVYLPEGESVCRVEIGRPEDFDWLAGYQQNEDLQAFLATLAVGQRLSLIENEDGLRLMAGETLLGSGTSSLAGDVRQIADRLTGTAYRSHILEFGPIYCLGLRTLAVEPEHLPKRFPAIHRRTGLVLAPIVSGFSRIKFVYRQEGLPEPLRRITLFPA